MVDDRRINEDTTGLGFLLAEHESRSFLVQTEDPENPLICKVSEHETGGFELSFSNLSPASVNMLIQTPLNTSTVVEFMKVVDQLQGQPIEVFVRSPALLSGEISFDYKFNPGTISGLLRKAFGELRDACPELPAEFSATVAISLPSCVRTPDGGILSLKLEAERGVLTIPSVTTRDIRSMLSAVLGGKKLPVERISLKGIVKPTPRILDVDVSGRNRRMNTKIALAPDDTPDTLIAKVIRAVCDQVGGAPDSDRWRVEVLGFKRD